MTRDELARRGEAIRKSTEPLLRPPFSPEALDLASTIAAQATVVHREADQERDPVRRAELRRAAVRLDQEADLVVPVEYRP